MAEWPASGETDWNVKMLAYLAIEHNTDGTHKATEVTAVVTGEGIFGSWATTDSVGGNFAAGSVYKAESDGTVFFYTTANTTSVVQILTDSSNPPTTIRTYTKNNFPGSASCPVRKNDYWKIVNNGITITEIYWLPIGSGDSVKQ